MTGTADRSTAVARQVVEQWSHRFAEFDHEAVERTALRTRSTDVREVLAHAAAGRGFAETLALVAAGGLEHVHEPRWLESLALVVGLQDLEESDTADACALYRALALAHGPTWLELRHRIAYAELLLIADERQEAAAFVDAALDGVDQGKFLRVDLHNPAHGGDPAAWTDAWRQRFEERGLPAPTVDESAATRFDGLVAPRVPVRTGGPFVSVVMTAFRPGADLLVAARSILAQSWRNLELIVVDDASGPEFDDVLRAVEGLDDRVEVVRLETNGGTYRARNVGIEHARGSIVAGMDSDDWSHPLRLELQLRPFLDDPDVVATRCRAWTVSPALHLHRRGVWPERWCEGSLMFRRDIVRALGGYVDARKSADSELVGRLRAAGRTVVDVPLPLWITRITPETLSRADFRAGWHHPARVTMRGSWEGWHARVREGARSAVADGSSPHVPDRLAAAPAVEPRYDLVLVGDWRFDTPAARQWSELAGSAARAGLRVAVCQMDDPWTPVKPIWAPAGAAVELATDGVVGLVSLDDARAARLLLVVDARSLVLVDRAASSGLRADRVAVVGSAVQGWDAPTCERAAQQLWGVPVTWLPTSAAVRSRLLADGAALHHRELAATVDPGAWRRAPAVRHRRPAAVGALVGRREGRWTVPGGLDRGPEAGTAVVHVADRLVEGRVEGSRRRDLALLRGSDIPYRELLALIDVLVLDPGLEQVERIALECAAAGVVVTAETSDGMPGVVPWREVQRAWSDARALARLRSQAAIGLEAHAVTTAVATLHELIGAER
ncbi:glycosyltransferase family A protein [Cellulomonas gilvus]|uniref:Glycosyl transferase family 2 n=1 Tax=Cellulomonas gilvus (strain ATCC 13127 / NRRL B-14078) TaxID=593907 RepID=F8A0W8_CELGA|nr:glycosyltransferase family A protein [Cellulomonas gilvus]AEI11590.1 glycosyl transferase family 2 [Cellulomonas gilvus ATCC 13127]